MHQPEAGRFGVSTTTGHPDDPSDDQLKLTYDINGKTNNTRIYIDGQTPMLTPNTDGGATPLANDVGVDGWVWNVGEVRVEQELQLIPGELSRRTDTVQVHYRLTNTGGSVRRVGLRVMIDTLIGENDGVPFFIPGLSGMVTAPVELQGDRVPESIRALQRPNLESPGVVVDIGLRSGEAERPGMVCLTHWPGGEAGYDYDRFAPFGADTAVGLYYEDRPLPPGESRLLGFTYGLGSLSATGRKDARLSLTTSGSLRAGAQFYLVGLIQDPGPGLSARLTLPEGLTLVEPSTEIREVPPGDGVRQVDWLIAAASGATGPRELVVGLEPAGPSEALSVNLRPRDARLILTAQGPFAVGSPFWISAVVQAPGPGHRIRLELPPELVLEPGYESDRAVEPTAGGFQQVLWLVRAGPAAAGTRSVGAVLDPGAVREGLQIEVRSRNFLQP